MKPFLLLVFLSNMLYHPKVTTESVVIKGTVLNSKDSSPVHNAYVYATKGEEEGLTSANGQFEFGVSSQSAVAIVVEHPDFVTKSANAISYAKNTIYLEVRTRRLHDSR